MAIGLLKQLTKAGGPGALSGGRADRAHGF